MKNPAESPPISANEQPGFSANNSKNNFASNFNFKLPLFWYNILQRTAYFLRKIAFLSYVANNTKLQIAYCL